MLDSSMKRNGSRNIDETSSESLETWMILYFRLEGWKSVKILGAFRSTLNTKPT